jgi:YfiH family protein
LVGGHKRNLKQHLKNKNFKLIKQDICSLDSNSILFKNVDYVYHFAGIGDIVPSIERPTDYMNVNVQGTVKVLEASRKANVKKFVYAASASCYGLNNSVIDEKEKINTEHPYALSKYLGERAALHWGKVYNLPVNVIRIFNAYGTRVRTTGAYGAVFGVFFKQKIKNKPLTVVGNGKQARDFIYVTDVANAFYLASELDKQNKERQILEKDLLNKVLNDISDFYKVDGIVTKIPGIGLSILGADCAPILFYDKIEKIIAACHAGWRGAVDNIVEKTIHKMESIGAKRNQISAVIGPAIQKNSYEIGQEVADIIQNCSFFSNKIPILSHEINDKYLFNLPLFLQQCLKNAEIVNIGNVELDTYTNPHLFFSHRRSSHKNMNETGRQISVIGILE